MTTCPTCSRPPAGVMLPGPGQRIVAMRPYLGRVCADCCPHDAVAGRLCLRCGALLDRSAEPRRGRRPGRPTAALRPAAGAPPTRSGRMTSARVARLLVGGILLAVAALRIAIFAVVAVGVLAGVVVLVRLAAGAW